MKILVTGAAGFIGYHLINKLLEKGHEVVGIDNINDYYDVKLKYGRLSQHGIEDPAYGVNIKSNKHEKYSFVQLDIEHKLHINKLFEEHNFDAVCNLAAQAGVRYSLENPDTYIETNIMGFLNILEACRHYGVNNLSYASSSSVYGLNKEETSSIEDSVDHPVSLYAATKKSNELLAHTYSHLFGISTTGLRFFTVYGPWGRPDMALFLFTNGIVKDEPIDVYNNGEMFRDFTYVDDIVDGVVRVIENPAKPNENWNGTVSSSTAPYRVYNIGNGNSVKLLDFVHAIEDKLGKKAKINFKPMQPGDVVNSKSDCTELTNDLGYKSKTDILQGISNFVDWYKEFYYI